MSTSTNHAVRSLTIISGQELSRETVDGDNKVTFLSSYLKLMLQAFSGDIVVITPTTTFRLMGAFTEYEYGPGVSVRKGHITRTGSMVRITSAVKTQLRILSSILSKRRADIYLFFLGQAYIFPIVVLRLLGRRVVLVTGTSVRRWSKPQKDLLLRFMEIEEKISYQFANHILVYSQALIKEWEIERYRYKISIASRHYIDFDRLKVIKRVDERKNVIGFIGRLSEDKGITNFIRAIPLVLQRREDISFSIAGEGKLREEVLSYLRDNHLHTTVTLKGWIRPEDIPKELNKLKALVMPSYIEGLSNIMLEAMACGTPVLATNVGAAPDIIQDELTGFIVENDSPECIARNILRVLQYPNLDAIANNALALVRERFSFEAAVQRYQCVLAHVEDQTSHS